MNYPIRLYNSENGIFNIRVEDGTSHNQLTAKILIGLKNSLEFINQQDNAKIILLEGNDEIFLSVADEQAEVRKEELISVLLENRIPIMSIIKGHSQGLGFLIGLLSDFVLLCKESQYNMAYLWENKDIVPYHCLLEQKYGQDFMNHSPNFYGHELKNKKTGITLLSKDTMDHYKMALAHQVVQGSQLAIHQLKKHYNQCLKENLFLDHTKSTPMLLVWSKIIKEMKIGNEAQLNVCKDNKLKEIDLGLPLIKVQACESEILLLTMNDPGHKNLFSEDLVNAIVAAFQYIADHKEYKAVILIGCDQYFSCGGTKEGVLSIQRGEQKYSDAPLYELVLNCEIPIISAMQGHGIGAGWVLGLFCDIHIFSKESIYTSKFMQFGFTPGFGSTLIFPVKLGFHPGIEILYSAKNYTGEDLIKLNSELLVVERSQVQNLALEIASHLSLYTRDELIKIKQDNNRNINKNLKEFIKKELEMHEITFIGNNDVRERVNQLYDQNHAIENRTLKKNDCQKDPPLTNQGQITDQTYLEDIKKKIKHILSQELYLNEKQIKDDIRFIDVGMDSIIGVTFIKKVNEEFGFNLSATQVYNYPTIIDFSDHILNEGKKQGLFLPITQNDPSPVKEIQKTSPTKNAYPLVKIKSIRRNKKRFAIQQETSLKTEDRANIAIIGMSGQFPMADDLQTFWKNLKEGKNCIKDIPKERWDVNQYYDQDRNKKGKTYCKAQGIVESIADFDPLFFNLSPVEAKVMDPQQRIFLQTAWQCFEDAGYNPYGLSGTKCGVYIGCAAGDYGQAGPDTGLNAQGLMGASTSILASRISYFLNLQGPCLAIDTACSSSLVAISTACNSLVLGETSMALAGGVCVLSGPSMHIMTSKAGMLSEDGRCFTFDNRANGFVPGEGVGALLLKRLDDAVRDNDHIYGLIRGWAVNQDGKTNGITAPNGESQCRLETEVYEKYQVNPESITFVEAHGTATKLGDPIEVEALIKTFKKFTNRQNYCALGSVKSNIGHLLTAAGVSGVIKVLLALKNKQIPATINFENINEHIHIKNSPFYINTRLKDWEVKEGMKRRAAVSSFGFSGTNAHLVIEEYLPQKTGAQKQGLKKQLTPKIIVLSAKSRQQIREQANHLLKSIALNDYQDHDLLDIAYTLQIGRQAMEVRLGFIVSSINDLKNKLKAYGDGKGDIDQLYEGTTDNNNQALGCFYQGSEFQNLTRSWIKNENYEKLLELWVNGFEISWDLFYQENQAQRISLPGYPFVKEKYWIENSNPAAVTVKNQVVKTLHPLIHENTSDLEEQRFTSVFTGNEFFLQDHQIKGNKVLPGAAYLEMVRFAIEKGVHLDRQMLILENIVWINPFVFDEKQKKINIGLYANESGKLVFEVFGSFASEKEDEAIYCQGNGSIAGQIKPAVVRDIKMIREKCQHQILSGPECYAIYQDMDINFGTAHQVLQEINIGTDQVIARLELGSELMKSQEDYGLHPAVMDGAFQATIGLLYTWPKPLQGSPGLPFALDRMEIMGRTREKMWVILGYADDHQKNSPIKKVNIDICDEQGKICVSIKGYAAREITEKTEQSLCPLNKTGTLVLAPVWKEKKIETASQEKKYKTRLIFTCEIEQGLEEKAGLQIIVLKSKETNLAKKYAQYASTVFKEIKKILKTKPVNELLVQILVQDSPENQIYRALMAILKTAQIENPRFKGQLILCDQEQNFAAVLEESLQQIDDDEIKYHNNTRKVIAIQEVAQNQAVQIPWQDQGVYLINGGLGGLGFIFAREIGLKTRGSRVILTGRSNKTDRKQVKIRELESTGLKVAYHCLDVCKRKEVERLLKTIQKKHGKLNGIIHSAAIIQDNFIINKSENEFLEVLKSKVSGLVNMDECSAQIDLDMMVFFSSIAGVTGNAGQADYSCANAFMDRYAEYRTQLVKENKRKGKTISINWPLWKDGGMKVDQTAQKLLKKNWGMIALKTDNGVNAFYHSMLSDQSQLLVIEGEMDKIQVTATDTNQTVNRRADQQKISEPEFEINQDLMHEKLILFLKRELSQVLKLKTEQIRENDSFEKYGIDSIMAMQLTDQLEKSFGSLSKTLFFEYQTLEQLNQYLLNDYQEQVITLLGLTQTQKKHNPTLIEKQEIKIQKIDSKRKKKSRYLTILQPEKKSAIETGALDIAIIGLSGQYPGAKNIDEYWNNLKNGKNCIKEVPKERWDWRDYFSEDRSKPGYHYSKYGGFIEDADQFDPLFFNISPLEADAIDPQERLFIEQVWRALEDAGYTRNDLQKAKAGNQAAQVGVYAGVMYSEYQLYGAESSLRGNRVAFGGNIASIANRVSYFLNINGPSMSIDTMCSSSLTTIHLACQDLRSGKTALAIAGGVNLSLHPNKYLLLSSGQFISSQGHCESFGGGGDGYIPGEGVGVVLLKRLHEAISDNDQIYAVIKGSAINHGGKTSGYSVPNPRAQARVIDLALKEAKIKARAISYIEAHGTGTRLGDPIEITGLNQVFHQETKDKQYCYIGSVKSNIGHLESAAGIAGLTKVLLQMKYGKIVPSLHSEKLNPKIDFNNSPFMVNQELRDWQRPTLNKGGINREYPRLAGISAFGAGGSNAHIIVEEYIPINKESLAPHIVDEQNPVMIVLSAMSKEQLKIQAHNLYQRIIHSDYADSQLVNIAYTLQIGRETMEERLGILSQSSKELLDKLGAYTEGKSDIHGLYTGNINQSKDVWAIFKKDEDLQSIINVLIEKKKYEKLLELWVKGLEIDWNLLYQEHKPQKISLPTYPFLRKKYWVEDQYKPLPKITSALNPHIHPLLHENTSNLQEQRYSSILTGHEFFLEDHLVNGRKILPGVAYLEMARAAMEKAIEDGQQSIILEDIVWASPCLMQNEAKKINISLTPQKNGTVKFAVYTAQDREKIIYCQGKARLTGSRDQTESMDRHKIKNQCQTKQIQRQELYSIFENLGINYGNSFKTIETLSIGKDQVLAKLALSSQYQEEFKEYDLHPAIMDGALQATIGLLQNNEKEELKPALPYALDRVEIRGKCQEKMWVRASYSPDNAHGHSRKIDIDLCDEKGVIRIRLKGFMIRDLHENKAASKAEKTNDHPEQAATLSGALKLSPIWNPVPIKAADGHTLLNEQTIIVGGDTEQQKQLLKIESQALIFKIEATDQVEQLVQKLTQIENQIDSIKHVIWLGPKNHSFKATNDIIQAQEEGVIQVYRLIKALLKLGYASKPLHFTLTTIKTQKVHFNEEIDPTHAAIHGLIGSMSNELRNWKIRLADLPDQQPHYLKELLTLPENQGATILAYRDQIWYEEQLIEIKEMGSGTDLYRNNGVYVVIGGAGGLGQVWSKWMIEKYQAQIIWIGRKELNRSIQEKIDELSVSGPRPVYLSADATDYQSLQSAYQTIKAKYFKINGIIHSAIVLSDMSLIKMPEQDFRMSLKAKVDITVNLAKVFAKEKLDFVIFFSSLMSFTKSAGQSNYAAGCRFKDAFGHALHQKWACQVKVINWGYWGSVGIVANQNYREIMTNAGIGSIEPGEAMTLLKDFIMSPFVQMAYLKTLKPGVIQEINNCQSIKVQDKNAKIDLNEIKKDMVQGQDLKKVKKTMDTAKNHAVHAMLCQLLLVQLQTVALFSGSKPVIEQFVSKNKLASFYGQWLRESIDRLQKNKYIKESKDGYQVLVQLHAQQVWQEWQSKKLEWDDLPIALIEQCMRALPDILKRKVLATDILFPDSSMRLVEGAYKGNQVADFYNQVLTNGVLKAVQNKVKQKKDGQLRILEVGAGTGGTSELLFKKLQPYQQNIAEYAYTDLSSSFLMHAQEHYLPIAPYLNLQILNIELPLAGQGIQEGQYDIVIAANVLHATKNIRNSLHNIKAALKRQGLLFLNEMSDKELFLHLTFGLLEGWWLFEDGPLRIPGSPGLYLMTWKNVLEEEGFSNAHFPLEKLNIGQEIIVAMSDGMVIQQRVPAVGAEIQARPIRVGERNKPEKLSHQSLAKPKELTDPLLLDSIRCTLCQCFEKALKLESGQIRNDRDFVQYGVDSIVAVNLVNEINDQLNLTLQTLVIFDYSTINELAEHILKEHRMSVTDLFEQSSALSFQESKASSLTTNENKSRPPVANPGASKSAASAKELTDPLLLDSIRCTLCQCFEKALKLESGQIRNDRDFVQYGVDSIVAVNLVNEINDQLNLTLQTLVIFDYSTINELAEHILKEYRMSVTDLFEQSSALSFQESKASSLTTNENKSRPPVANPGASKSAASAKQERFFKADLKEQNEIFNDQSGFKSVMIERPGFIEDLKIVTSHVPALKSNEVYIGVRAFSLNFGDLLCVKGLYPTMPAYPFTPGFEVSGVILGCGDQVKTLKQGDAVVVIVDENFGGHSNLVICPEDIVDLKPEQLSFAEACSLPVVSYTMLDAFKKANLKKGERILIQTAAGGTGLIAVQLARYYGAEIYATAGSKAKLDYLAQLGVAYGINYLESDFEEEIMRFTNGQGVDVVINTLPGDAIQKGMNCLSPQGRYIEIAMTALKSARKIDLSVFNNNQAFFSVDLRRLRSIHPRIIHEYHHQLSQLINKGVVKPTVSRIFSFSQIQAAYRSLENRENIGKIVVCLTDQELYQSNIPVEKKSVSFPELVHLNKIKKGRPVFWFHGGFGDAQYHIIANKSRRPFYGIAARGLTGDSSIQGIKAMASYYIRIIRSVQAQGPYEFGGYSLGGLISYEVTRQLQEAGQKVKSITMIDALSDMNIVNQSQDKKSDNPDNKISFMHFALQTINLKLFGLIKNNLKKAAGFLISRDELDLDLDEQACARQLLSLYAQRLKTLNLEMSIKEHEFKEQFQRYEKVFNNYNVRAYTILPLKKPDEVQCYFFRNKSGLFLGELKNFFTLQEIRDNIGVYQYWKAWQDQITHFHIIDVDSANHHTLLSEPKVVGTILEFIETIYSVQGMTKDVFQSFIKKALKEHGQMNIKGLKND